MPVCANGLLADLHTICNLQFLAASADAAPAQAGVAECAGWDGSVSMFGAGTKGLFLVSAGGANLLACASGSWQAHWLAEPQVTFVASFCAPLGAVCKTVRTVEPEEFSVHRSCHAPVDTY